MTTTAIPARRTPPAPPPQRTRTEPIGPRPEWQRQELFCEPAYPDGAPYRPENEDEDG